MDYKGLLWRPVKYLWVDLMDYKAAEQKHIDEAMQDIREAMYTSAVPNADILELTDRVEEVDEQAEEEWSVEGRLDVLQEILSSDSIKDIQQVSRKFSEDEFFKKESGNLSKEELLEALKPQMNAWLDENLHAIVLKAVEKEVKKLVS